MLLRCLLLIATLHPLVASAQSAWTVGRTNLAGVTYINSIAFGNGRFVLTTSGNGADTPSVAWSTDGETWHPVRPAGNIYLPQQGTVRFVAGSFYLAASSSIFRSSDGATWEPVPLTDPLSGFRTIATDGRGMLVGKSSLIDKTLYFTADRTTWRRTAPLPESQLGQVSVGDIACIAGRYFVAYNVMLANFNLRAFVVATTDGTAWDPVPEIPGDPFLADGNGRLIAFLGGSIATSADGRTFTRTAFNPNPTLINGGRLGFAGGRFFFLGSLQASFDGLTWNPLATNPTVNAQIFDIAYGNGRYIAIGRDNNPGAAPDLVLRLTATAAPAFSTPPTDRALLEGEPLSFSVTMANVDPTITFQWRRDGQPIAGATSATFNIARTTLADAGRYSVEARNALGTTVSHTAVVTISHTPPPPPPEPGRIINLSVLSELHSDEPEFLVGFVVGGTNTSGSKPVLVRAGGPSLARFNLTSPNADPRLELFSGQTKISENDNWNGAGTLVEVGQRVGAFPYLTDDSKDAAVFSNLPLGDSSVRLTANNGATGALIAEVYDASPAGSLTLTTPRLVNVSVRKTIRSGNALKAGFVIGGATKKTVLVRAVGPFLEVFGVSGLLADPRLAVYRAGESEPFATNDDWGGSKTLADSFHAVGAFVLPVGSRDAAILLTLDPGNYIAEAQGAPGTAGVALVEVYEVP